MNELLDLDRLPLDGLDGARGRALLAHRRKELHRTGMFNLERLVRSEALERCIAEVEPVLASAAFTHARKHNVYFEDEVPHLGRLTGASSSPSRRVAPRPEARCGVPLVIQSSLVKARLV